MTRTGAGMAKPALDEQASDKGVSRGSTLQDLPLHRGSFIPLHRQVHDIVRREIVAGRLAPGTRLPSEGELAARWGVSLAPIRQAFVDLTAEGYLERGRGRGTFVRPHKFEEKLSVLSSFSESHAQQGDSCKLVVISSGQVPAEPEVASALGVKRRKLVLIKRLALLDGSPSALLSAYLDPARFPGVDKAELEDGSLYRTLESVYGCKLLRAESTVEVVNANEEEASTLETATGIMLLRVDSVTYDQDDVAVEFSRALYRVERFRFKFESYRVDGRTLSWRTHPPQKGPGK